MKPGVNLAEPAQLDAGIDLGRGDRGVAEHFLDDAQIGAAGEEVGGEAVPERVRADVARSSRPPAAWRLTICQRPISRQAAGPTSRRTPRRSRGCWRPGPGGRRSR